MPIHSRLPFLIAVLLLSLAACTSEPTGSVQFLASVPQALSASDVTRVKVTVSAADMPSRIVELARSNGSWGGLIGNLPAGSSRVFLAEAFDSSGTLRFQGSASGVSITANQTTAVAITLQQVPPPPPYSNEAPVIGSLVASSTSVQTGASLSLTATVQDPNPGDTLTLAWTASSGTFSAPGAVTTSWTAPSSTGVQTLTLTVTDSQGTAVSVSLAINVTSGVSTGNAALNISFNLWPVVSRVSASLNRLDTGQSTAVSSLASDADGDALSYQWTATCPGTWTNATSSAASFVPSSVPAGACNNCRLTVTVQDGRGGQNTGSINLCIASSSTQRFAPLITNFYQSAIATSPEQTVTFDVTAMDPQSSAMTFAWTANTGSLGMGQNTASTSQVVWTAPSCTGPGVTPTVTVTVTNAYGLSASKAFSLSGPPACAATWSSAGSMASARYRSTATRLLSGKVLVAGGSNGSALSSAELYDPATNSWSAAGSMAAARYAHTATLLPSGKVLVSGGTVSSTGYLSSAELYDPATNSWSSAPSMASARELHTATLLPSGKVLVTGGYTGSAISSVELYDPATNSWSSAPSMASARYNHPAVLLSSGKVLVTGGFGATQFLSATEVYDPATNSWSLAGSMAVARFFHTATLLPSGAVLVSGGRPHTNYNVLRSAEVQNPATNAWSLVGSMSLGRECHTATLLSSNKVLVVGGNGTTSALLSAEEYDPATNSWSWAAFMTTERYCHAATLLLSGKVLVAGGYNGSYLSSAELYTP